MAFWLMRAGAHGEYGQKFLRESRVYVAWEELDVAQSQITERKQLLDEMTKRHSDAKSRAIASYASQVLPFAKEIKQGGLVIVPAEAQRAIAVAETTGDYHFEPKGPDPSFDWRTVKWVAESVPRSNLGQDLQYSFGAVLATCRVQKDDAERGIAAMRANGWKAETAADMSRIPAADSSQANGTAADLERLDNEIKAELPLKSVWRVADAVTAGSSRLDGYRRAPSDCEQSLGCNRT